MIGPGIEVPKTTRDWLRNDHIRQNVPLRIFPFIRCWRYVVAASSRSPQLVHRVENGYILEWIDPIHSGHAVLHTVCGRTQFISRKRKTRLIPNLPAGEGMVEPCPKCEYIYNTGGQNAKR